MEAPAYHPPISLRLASLLSVVVLAAAAIFVVHDRGQLAVRIEAKRAGYAQCLRHAGANTAANRRLCGSASLSSERNGDLIGLPFIALAFGLFCVLVYEIARHRGEEPTLNVGDARASDDALL